MVFPYQNFRTLGCLDDDSDDEVDDEEEEDEDDDIDIICR